MASFNFDNGQLTLGGSGERGRLQLKSPTDGNTIFIGASETQALALLGGRSGHSGVVRLHNPQGPATIALEGDAGNILLGANPSDTTPGQDGDLLLRDGKGGISIQLNGSNGNCQCVSVTEESDIRLKKEIAPLLNALNKVLAMQGVCYQRKQEDSSKETLSEDSQIGFIGQEMETLCPEIVCTDSEGYKSINYSRLTPILVEAIKEQHQLIQQQASALGEALQKIAQIETTMKLQGA